VEEIRLAVALKYAAEEDEAPVVIASGRGKVAERMVAAANSSGVPLHEDKSLAVLLAQLETGTEIPPELYQAVAQVIAFVWGLDRRYSPKEGKHHEG